MTKDYSNTELIREVLGDYFDVIGYDEKSLTIAQVEKLMNAARNNQAAMLERFNRLDNHYKTRNQRRTEIVELVKAQIGICKVLPNKYELFQIVSNARETIENINQYT